ncbi:MAG: FAD:protein FMN transferase [Mailhella sp.]|nr:FAD:protein FMN transferase [Mailhella sp.]
MLKKSKHCSRRAFLAGAAACGATLLLPSFAASAAENAYQQTTLFMGTIVRIDIAGVPLSMAEDACAVAFTEGMHLERLLTRHRGDSPLGVLNSQGSLRDVPAPLETLLDMSASVHRLSGGAFDPTVLPVLQALEKTRSGHELSASELASCREMVGFDKLERAGGLRLMQEGMAVTLDGIAKGYIAQRMSDVLVRKGCVNHLVNAGGDIVARGCSSAGRAWQIAVQDPAHRQAYPSVLALSGNAVATSGVYEQKFDAGGGSHLIDPASCGKLDVLSSSVIAPSGALADALATAFSIMQPRQAVAAAAGMPGVEVLLVMGDGYIVKSAGWPA